MVTDLLNMTSATLTMNEILAELKALHGQVTSQIIADLIDMHQSDRNRMIHLYRRYKALDDGVPIFSREVAEYETINHHLNNDFFGEIVDTKVGYFMGIPITYGISHEADNYEAKDETIQDFIHYNLIEDLDSETAKMAAICGLGSRLLYIDVEGRERAMNVPPWETIFVYDRSIQEAQYALRYYPIGVVPPDPGGEPTERIRVEWYDQTHVTFYIQDDQGNYVLDDTEPINPRPHMFDGIPLVAFTNNEEQQGDAEKVLSLIDAYDRALSDQNSEIEAYRAAYMLFYGFEVDEETLSEIKRTGAFGIPTVQDGSKVEFLTKDLNDQYTEKHLDRLEQNILRFGKSVNFGDEHFAGNISGVAMKFKMFALESKCMIAERKFTAALQKQFDLLTSVWAKKGLAFDQRDITYQFKRNFPLNMLDEAQTNATLKGLVSEKTRLSLLSFVEDPEEELQAMEQEIYDLVPGDPIQGVGDLNAGFATTAARESADDERTTNRTADE
jgi:SPP1 family phage portal protein